VGKEKIYLVAAEYRGPFSFDEAQKFFDRAAQTVIEKNACPETKNYDLRLVKPFPFQEDNPYRHAVFGWCNADRTKHGFIALHIDPDSGSGGQFLVVPKEGKAPGQPASFHGAQRKSWAVAGKPINIAISAGMENGEKIVHVAFSL